MTLEDAIPLSELVEHLRSELRKAVLQGQGSEPRFLVVETELELEVVATKNLEGGGGVQFWVLKADAKTSKESAHTQKVKVKLRPVDETGESCRRIQRRTATRVLIPRCGETREVTGILTDTRIDFGGDIDANREVEEWTQSGLSRFTSLGPIPRVLASMSSVPAI